MKLEKVAKVVRGIHKEFSSFDNSRDTVVKRLDSALTDVQTLQTRVNVLGRKLEKGADTREDAAGETALINLYPF